MTRRLISLIAATTLVFALLPALAASASAAATANLDAANRDIFPGAGQDFGITLTNNEVGVAGTTVGAKAINWVRIILPASRGFSLGGAEGSVSKDGWQVIETRTARSQSLTFHGGSLAAGSSTTFNFPVDVARPADSDRNGPFQVMVSSDGGQTAEPADGSLTSLVRILQILSGEVVAPELAADGTGTAGQLVDYGVKVQNHALNAVAVTSNLTPRNGDTIEARPADASIAGNDGQHTFVYKVKLNPTITRDANHSYTTDAKKPDGSAVATARDFIYRVQVAPRLQLNEGSFQPKFVRPDSLSYKFEADFGKVNTPALTIHSGTLAFADTTVAIDTASSANTWQSNVEQQVVTNTTAVSGADGDYSVTYAFAVTDGNGYSFDQELTSSGALITIDGLGPIIKDLTTILPEDEDGVRQVRAKDGDTIRITGEVEDRNADRNGLTLTLIVDGGDDVSVPKENVSTTSTANGFRFDASVEPVFGVDEGDFHVQAEAADLAGNTGADVGADVGIDNLPPNVAVQGYLIEETPYDDKPVIEAVFNENYDILGGCNPFLYEVDGELLVRDVLFSNGEPCQAGKADPKGNNVRILRLLDRKDRAHETTVHYLPDSAVDTTKSDRVKDGAGHFSVKGRQDIISLVAPPLPTLDTVTRNAGTETAVFDEDKYWTRFGGNDLQVQITGAGVRRGDKLQVLDSAGTVLQESAPAPEDNANLTSAVPLGPDEDDYTRHVRLLSPRNVAGEARTLVIALDKTDPDIVSATRTGDQVEVGFNDVIWAGTNYASDWRAYEDDEGSHAEVGVKQVTGSREKRTLDVAWQGFGPFSAAEYLFENVGSNRRYEDRAGNLLPVNVFQPASGAM